MLRELLLASMVYASSLASSISGPLGDYKTILSLTTPSVICSQTVAESRAIRNCVREHDSSPTYMTGTGPQYRTHKLVIPDFTFKDTTDKLTICYRVYMADDLTWNHKSSSELSYHFPMKHNAGSWSVQFTDMGEKGYDTRKYAGKKDKLLGPLKADNIDDFVKAVAKEIEAMKNE